MKNIWKLLILVLVMISSSAFAVNCEKLKTRADSAKRHGKKLRLSDKYQALCLDKVSKSDWQQKKKSNKSQYKCANLKQRLAKVNAKGKQGRAQNLQKKIQELGCQ
jgi:hypothetical protein